MRYKYSTFKNHRNIRLGYTNRLLPEFILRFFENKEYAGWHGIAEKLIENGEAVVAGNAGIWAGGIGNFVKYSDPGDGFIGCTKYTFDLENFLKSEYFRDYRAAEYGRLRAEYQKFFQQRNELLEL